MYLKSSTNHKTGRTYLSCVYGYRDIEGKSRTKTYRSFGYLDELEQRYKDPVAHFSEIVAQFNKEQSVQEKVKESLIGLRRQDRVHRVAQKNLGYSVPYTYYRRLKVESLWKNVQQKEHLVYDLNSVFRLLTLLRVLEPTQMVTSLRQKDMFFERSELTDEQILEGLELCAHYSGRFYRVLRRHLETIYQPDLERGFFNLERLYFGLQASPDQNLRQQEQQARPQPTMQCGCLCDAQGMPLEQLKLEDRNLVSDRLPGYLEHVRQEQGLKRLVVVSDLQDQPLQPPLVFSNPKLGSLIGLNAHQAPREIRDWMLEESWDEEHDDYRIKSRSLEVPVQILQADHSIRDDQATLKFVCVFAKQVAEEQRRAQQDHIVWQMGDLSQQTLRSQKPTAQLLNKEAKAWRNQICQRELLDGYVLIATTEDDLTAPQIAADYRRLRDLHRVLLNTKPYLVVAPSGFSRQDYLKLHFMVCYLACVLLNLVKLNSPCDYNPLRIAEELSEFDCVNISENRWLITHWSKTAEQLLKSVGLYFSGEPMTLGEVRHQIASCV
ncbi:MAG: hypothetical protein LBL67_01570 [Coriobacteriales bacterium]|jgi:hypothetical protein|nr:hypothetical protein [Coriobacteriales bacterium]